MTRGPDIIARVRLFSEGRRHKPIPAVCFGCPLVFDREAFDCWLLLDRVGISLCPGKTADVPVAFLNPQHIKPRLHKGDHFTLWEFGDFAEGEVLEVIEGQDDSGCPDPSTSDNHPDAEDFPAKRELP